MKYARLIKNDIVDGEGICVSLWLQGCLHKCKGCHNPETWNKDRGIEVDEEELTKQVLEAISANGIKRNFSLLGGEPLAPYNVDYSLKIVTLVKEKYPDIEIYIWTGYIYENLNNKQKEVVNKATYLIDGPYIQEQRDITLPLRGSSNQRIIKIN